MVLRALGGLFAEHDRQPQRMTRHRTTVFLAMCWALVVPPSGENGPRAPTVRWQQVGVFKSAKECEAVRAELIAAARRPFGDPWMVPEWSDREFDQKISWADSHCLPTTIPGDTEPQRGTTPDSTHIEHAPCSTSGKLSQLSEVEAA